MLDNSPSQENALIDADFAGMAGDEEYRAEAEAITAEFVVAGWEALLLADVDSLEKLPERAERGLC